MSPLPLRRYRAERLLTAQFEALRASVIARVRKRLAAGGAAADAIDLEACYAAAWQGLYGALLEGREIANPAGWLVVVTLRRALDELRAGARTGTPLADADMHGVHRAPPDQDDLARELDDRARLGQLIEGIRRLGPREREAAALCYLHGLTRAEAAARMGISDRAMRRLMEGGRTGRDGVAAKVGRVLDAIREGRWCEEQRSLMAALAFGVLDPAGERYRLASAHRERCPACRAYVVSLRGLAALLPPPLLPLLRDASLAHGAGAAAGTGKGAAAAAGSSPSGAGAASLGSGASGGTGAGAGAAGGWVLGGTPLGAKLAVGCALLVGLGAGCSAVLQGGAHSGRAPAHVRSISNGPVRPSLVAIAHGGHGAASTGASAVRGRPGSRRRAPTTSSTAGAPLEFGPERDASRASVPAAPHRTTAPGPVAASAAAQEFAP